MPALMRGGPLLPIMIGGRPVYAGLGTIVLWGGRRTWPRVLYGTELTWLAAFPALAQGVWDGPGRDTNKWTPVWSLY